LNKEWAIQRKVQLKLEKISLNQEKEEKRLEKQITKADNKAVNQDPDKQPMIIPYNKNQQIDYVFCGANACTKFRKEVPVGRDDGWRKCCVVTCSHWLCSSGNCSKQMKTHINKYLYAKTYKEQYPYI
jgi:hypothetical protein